MNDINKHTEDNLGGIFSIKIIPVSDVQSIPMPIKSRILQAVVLKNNTRWYDLYATEQTIKFEEPQQESEHGNFFRCKLTGLVPKDRADVIELFNEMANKLFVIDYTDNNGVRKLIGNLSEPLTFSSNFDTGSTATNKNGYSFEFKGDLIKKSPVYFV